MHQPAVLHHQKRKTNVSPQHRSFLDKYLSGLWLLKEGSGAVPFPRLSGLGEEARPGRSNVKWLVSCRLDLHRLDETLGRKR